MVRLMHRGTEDRPQLTREQLILRLFLSASTSAVRVLLFHVPLPLEASKRPGAWSQQTPKLQFSNWKLVLQDQCWLTIVVGKRSHKRRFFPRAVHLAQSHNPPTHFGGWLLGIISRKPSQILERNQQLSKDQHYSSP